MQVLIEKGSPSRTLAWILFLLMAPVIGIYFYFIFGKNQRKEMMFKRAEDFPTNPFLPEQYLDWELASFSNNQSVQKNKKLIKLLMNNEKAVLTNGNRIQILNNGPATFTAIFEAIRNAKSFIHMEYYIFKEGNLARMLLSLLTEKVREGVAVRIIFDGVGSRNLRSRFLEKFKNAGIEIYPFMPVRFGLIANKINYRNHRKIIVIDGNIGFTGGTNIDDKYQDGDPELGEWRDTHLGLSGPAVKALNLIFKKDWFFVSGQRLEDYSSFTNPNHRTGIPIQIISSGPNNDYASIRQEYFTLINSAQSYIYISTPYFIPGEAILLALKTAALSGVEVIMALPKKSDYALLKWSIRSYLEELLGAGVRIFTYQKGFLHSKVFISDDQVASIGTANVDERSFESNFEVNALLYDQAVCQELKGYFFEDLAKSEELIYPQFKQRPRKERIKESAARLFSPLL